MNVGVDVLKRDNSGDELILYKANGVDRQMSFSTLSNGMGYVLNLPMPIYSQWLSCSIISEYLDTQFNLYYSSLSSVEEELTEPFRVVAAEGLLRIENESPVEITVFDVLGRVVAKRSQVDRCELHLNPGLYIVSNGNQVVKAVVR